MGKSLVNSSEPVHALYVSGWGIGQASTLKHFVDLANRTEINTYVVDVKEDDGLVSFPSKVALAKELKTSTRKFDPALTISQLHKNNIRIIGRIVCFKDPVLPLKRPDLALKDKQGKLWRDNDGIAWINPYNKTNWKYLVDLAKEALDLGFDEIQFDYVRFTNNGDMSKVDFGNSPAPKFEAINGFLSYARSVMPNAVLSADVFGIICESPGDTEGIGQYLEKIGENMNYISPMIYPSHYYNNSMINNVNFPKPDLDPYGIVYNAMYKAQNRVKSAPKFKAQFRPWLQDFTQTDLGKGNFQVYGAKQVREQIEAAKQAGCNGWIFWNVDNKYSEDAFLPTKK